MLVFLGLFFPVIALQGELSVFCGRLFPPVGSHLLAAARATLLGAEILIPKMNLR